MKRRWGRRGNLRPYPTPYDGLVLSGNCDGYGFPISSSAPANVTKEDHQELLTFWPKEMA
eukprot:7509121-Heterocapsa_arctica.AAC.1